MTGPRDYRPSGVAGASPTACTPDNISGAAAGGYRRSSISVRIP
jgi:hypothetical protein